uniref:dolichol kinase n=1 Tax=Saccoglossus kowalevskii TaxID=10224 RepID=A0ABM0MCL8_SACKO|nr:PREDICTED: dolichol kinase-like [Saccoglossus kowalevskii]
MDSVLNITGYYSKPKLHSCLQVLLLGALFIGLAMYPTLYTMRQVRMMQEVNQYEPFLWKWSISFYIGTMVFILSVLQSWLWYLLGENPILFALYFIFDNQIRYIRVFGIKPFGEALHDAFSVFIDDRDVGIPILTHIYLLLGFSLPVWLYPLQHDQGCTLLMYSGVLSLGIGDTAAALFGSMYGHYKWPGSKKTKEGTAAAIVLQILFCCLLSLCGVKIPSWASVIFAVVCTSLLESFTSQIDNIILPLFMYCVLAVLL